jgi:hypothetical protein
MQDRSFDPLPVDDTAACELTDHWPPRPSPALLLRARVLDGVPVLDVFGRLEGSGVAAVEALLTMAWPATRVGCPVT